jgi:hypothetical protein
MRLFVGIVLAAAGIAAAVALWTGTEECTN